METMDFSSTDSESSASAASFSNTCVLPSWDNTGLRRSTKRILPSTRESSLDSQRPSVKDHVPAPATVDDERLINQSEVLRRAIIRDLNKGVMVEATLPDGLLSVSLFKHQKIALAWMLEKENSLACCGGILADDQGLGKTVSVIALILMQKSLLKPKSVEPCVSKVEVLDLDSDTDDDTSVVNEDKQAGESDEVKLMSKVSSSSSTQEPHSQKPPAGSLVVCPASVFQQWARELDEKVADEAKLEVLIYHGGKRTKDPNELAKYDVVLTTYSIVANEVPPKPFCEDDDDPEFANKRKKFRKGIEGTLTKVHWFRVILDEAHTIKNCNTQVAKSCCGLRAKKRWCLSGTPIQNSVGELFSYFRFLKCEPYTNYGSFRNQIIIPIIRSSECGYRKLQAVLKAIMLRRTKDTLIDGKPIIDLPPKTINLTTIEFSNEEKAFYLKLEAESRLRFKAYHAAGTVKQNYRNILSMLLRLRQACNHPLLIKGFNSESISPVSTKMEKNLPKDMQANLLHLLETSFICLLCSDLPEDAVVTICGHVFCCQCVFEYLGGNGNTCPSPNCKSQIGGDTVFSEADLRSCKSDDDDDDDDDRSLIFQSDYTSSKIRATLEIIQSHCRSNSSQSEGPIKAIIFSQWTRMLDLVETSLNQHCIEFRRLDGSMSPISRDMAVKEFNTDPEVIVMLMSLKAGNVGLNMVAASHVILLDLWWNPATEDQAIDRSHRIGQTRPVTVSRLTIKDTVEDRILALLEEKRELLASVFGENRSGSSGPRMTAEDLRYLFMGNL